MSFDSVRKVYLVRTHSNTERTFRLHSGTVSMVIYNHLTFSKHTNSVHIITFFPTKMLIISLFLTKIQQMYQQQMSNVKSNLQKQTSQTPRHDHSDLGGHAWVPWICAFISHHHHSSLLLRHILFCKCLGAGLVNSHYVVDVLPLQSMYCLLICITQEDCSVTLVLVYSSYRQV